MKIQPRQIKKLHTLLNKLDLMDQKLELIHHYTNRRTQSSRSMTYHEACNLIEALEEQTNGSSDSLTGRDRMVRKMMYYGYLLGYDKPRAGQSSMPAKKICFANVDAWCKSDKCSIKKSIRDMDNTELNKALSQFEMMYKNTLTKLA